ncbi:hypothetical protein ACA910_000249 [Epithemia clementina (nom. ined.)]
MPNDPAQIFKRKIQRPMTSLPKKALSSDLFASILASAQPTPSKPPFQFILSCEADETNSAVIANHHYNIQEVINAPPGSTISPGSEFRPVATLQRLFSEHPFWPKAKQILTDGARYHITTTIPESMRLQENDAILAYGNHASATKRPDALTEGFVKDTEAGYSIPLSVECARKIVNSRISPIGVAQHAGIDEKGEIVLKDRLAHDQSFSLGFAPSINELVDDTNQIDLVFGWCLERIIHQIVALRILHPSERIMICKFDWGSAYRRINGDGTVAASSITMDATGKFANMLFRLSFGGKTHPAIFSTMSEWRATYATTWPTRTTGTPTNASPDFSK